jgi:fumarate hydratase class II
MMLAAAAVASVANALSMIACDLRFMRAGEAGSTKIQKCPTARALDSRGAGPEEI